MSNQDAAHAALLEAAALYAAGALPDDERRGFESHAATCAECADELRRLQPIIVGLALANLKRGNTSEGRLWLGKAALWLDQLGDRMPRETRDLGLHRHAWLEAHVLRREAEGLLRAAD